jgi:Kef-type K+ transport system membrane component KefB
MFFTVANLRVHRGIFILCLTSMSSGPEQLLLELLAIFVAAKIFGEVFERLSLPAVLGEILAGAILGPYALKVISPSESMQSIAEIGAIFVLFSAGLETSPQELIGVGTKAMAVAIGGVVVPFALGFVYMGLRGNSTTESVFVGAAMVATSVGISARVLADLGVTQTHNARIILGAAVFDDILGMLVLALVTGFSTRGGIHWLHIGVVTAEALTFALFMILVAPHLVRHIRPGVEQLSTRDAPLVIALLLCLFLSWLSLQIGMAAIIGAFFAGLMFADYAPEWDLFPRVEGITEFLAPYFFFAIGARLDLSLLNRKVLMAAAVISSLAIVSKIIGCGLPLLNQGWQTVFSVGIGMMPRGEVALIVALVGLNSKTVSAQAYAIVVLMTAVTTILAPPLMRFLFREGRAVSSVAAH